MPSLYRYADASGDVVIRNEDNAWIWVDSNTGDAMRARAYIDGGGIVDQYVPPPPRPQFPDMGTDVDSEDQFQTNLPAAVTQIRAYINNASPTNAQVIAITKLLCRIILRILVRMRTV